MLLLAFALGAPASEIPKSLAEPFPLGQVTSGLVGTGFTVLRGEAVTSFKAEVQGVVQQDKARGPMIVCELSGEGLENTGVLEAMSGSPIYVEGKLLGAVAYAWPFSKKSLCGVTPAAQLLSLLENGRGEGAAAGSEHSRAMTLATFWDGLGPKPVALRPNPELPSGPLGSLASAGFQWALADSPEGAKAKEASAPPLGPGSLIGVQLVSGDVEFAAFGTVAWSDGERFVAFGHPFMRLGAVDLPVVSARVAAIVPSLNKGMKLCSSGSPAGELYLDAGSGVAGRWGKRADMLPVEVKFEGTQSPARILRFNLARQRFITAALLEGALGVVQSSMEGVTDPKTATLRLSASMADGREVKMRALSFSGPAPFAAMNEFASSVLDLMLNNSYEPLSVSGLKLEITVVPGLSGGAPKAAWLEPDVVRRGEPVLLRVEFQPVQGAAQIHETTIRTEKWPSGEVELWVGDVFTLWRKLMGTEEAAPASSEEILRYLKEIPENDRLYVAAVAPSEGKVLQNRRLDEAPPSLSPLLGPDGPKTAAAPLPYRLIDIQPGPATGPAEGVLEISTHVENKKP